MKRTPLKRGKPLRATKPMARSRMKRSRRKQQPPHLRDDAYKAFISGQPCCAPGCGRRPPLHPHHHSLTGERGTAQRPHDRYCMPLCYAHHTPGLHQLAGPFKGWDRERLKAWQDEQVSRFQALYRAREGRAA